MGFTMNSPNILASIRLSSLDQAAHFALVPSAIREDDNTNVDAKEVVDVAMIEEDIKDVAVSEANA